MRMHVHDEDMATLERRLRMLLDAERMDRVTREAERSGRSVSAVIRGAIDFAYSDAQADHRKTSTLTPTPTRRPRSHHSYTLICEEPHKPAL